MKRQRRNWPDQHPVSLIDQQKFQKDGKTVFYNIAAAIIYSVFLYFTLNDATGLIIFFVLAVLQIILCIIMAVNFNSKTWLYSALVMFLLSCTAFIYVNT